MVSWGQGLQGCGECMRLAACEAMAAAGCKPSEKRHFNVEEDLTMYFMKN
jgi:hypothetical protein